MKKKTSAIIFSIKSHTFIKNVFYKLFNKKNASINSPEVQNKEAKHLFNYKYDCTNPRTFNEYLGWIKFNYSNALWERCADKLGTKSFLEELKLHKYIPRTIAVYSDVKDIDFDKLPDRFVLKTNHDSGTVFICDKNTSNLEEILSKICKSLNKNYSKNGEWVYSKIKPQIFAEELIGPLNGDKKLIDYKFFVYNGKFEWGFTGQNRDEDCRFCVFEKDFAIQDVDYIYLRPHKNNIPSKPLHFDEMVRIAELIGKMFWFVRVDFYDTDNGPFIGELTFFSQSGLGPFTKKEYDFKYGRLFENTPFLSLIHSKKS